MESEIGDSEFSEYYEGIGVHIYGCFFNHYILVR